MKEQLSANSDELSANSYELATAHLAMEEAKKAWEEAKKVWEEGQSYTLSEKGGSWPPTRSLRSSVVVSSVPAKSPMSLVTRLPLGFMVRYPELKIDEDPFMELPSNAEVLGPTEVPLDDHPTIPLALPPAY
ncbi:hypothetical protein BHE74_00046533 [Ensete ventricosum]|nr:hypothetical protein BHE74_00046533 [Ensete ventricosum]